MTGERRGAPSGVVFLDRDGVLNEDEPGFYVTTPDEWVPIPGSLEAVARLTEAGQRVVVVTNQAAIARGLLDEATLSEIHAKLVACVESAGGRIAGVFHCPHGADAGCGCRKPGTGLIERAERTLGVRAQDAPFVGDKESDLLAARRAGCRPILVRTGHGASWDARESSVPEAPVYANLERAVAALLAEADGEQPQG